MNQTDTSFSPARQHLVYLLFFLSGMSGLIYEVLWISRFGRLFGHTSFAIGTVLASYMGGMALGSFLIGRVADRIRNHILAYARLEILIAILALLVYPALLILKPVYSAMSWPYDHTLVNILRLVISLVILLPPTICMGGTLPVLTRGLTHQNSEAGQRLGFLYGLNTFGAVAGCATAGFYLLPSFGEYITLGSALFLNILVVVASLILSRSFIAPQAVSQSSTASTIKLKPAQLAALLALALAGFASMSLEIAWSRLISLTLGSSVYSFTAMLSIYLFGLAIGGSISGSILRRFKPNPFWLAGTLIVIAAVITFTLPYYSNISTFIGLFNTAAKGHFEWILAAIVLVCAAVVLIPAILMGTTIAFTLSIANEGSKIGRNTGVVYAANTFGGIAGSLLAGFTLLPLMGMQNVFLFCIACYITAALLVALFYLPRHRIASIISIILLGAIALTARNIDRWPVYSLTQATYLYGITDDSKFTETVFHRDGVSCTVTVDRYPNGVHTMRLNGKADSSTHGDMGNQLMTGHLGMFFKPDATNVLVIGYGSGVSAAAALQYQAERVYCAEMEKAVIEADPFFNVVNHSPLEDPRFRVMIEDGRNVIETTPEVFDVIISEPSNPWMAGIANLFTQDYYEECKDQLTEDGVICQWLQAYSTSVDDFKMIMKTFGSVFPHHAIFRVSSADYLLIGAEKELQPDMVTIQKAIMANPNIQNDLDAYCESSDIRALMVRYFMFEGDVYDSFCKDAKILRDYHNTLEYSAVRNLFTVGDEIIDKINYAIFGHKQMLLPKGTSLQLTGKDVALANSFVYIGDGAMKAGNIPLAEGAYELAARAYSGLSSVKERLLKIAISRGDTWTQHEATIQEIAKKQPGLLLDVSRHAFQHQAYEWALGALRAAYAQMPDSLTVKLRLASTLSNLGRPDEARVLLVEAKQMDPLNSEVQKTVNIFQQLFPDYKLD